MKMKSLFLIVCVAALTVFVQAQNSPTQQTDQIKKDSVAKISYAELLKKLQSGDTNIDYKALRMAYTETKDYSYDGLNRAERDKMFKPFNEKKYKEALKEAEKVLEKDYVEPNAHYIAYNAANELKDEKKAAFHKAILLGLLNAIQNGNDGLSAKTPFMAITIDEEYTLMNFMGYKHTSQSLQSVDGHQFDVFEAVNSKTNEKVKLYFNIDVIWKAESAIFGK